jgi:hypothetical protein
MHEALEHFWGQRHRCPLRGRIVLFEDLKSDLGWRYLRGSVVLSLRQACGSIFTVRFRE